MLLERRPAPGIWGGLWSPPQFDERDRRARMVPPRIRRPSSPRRRWPPIEHALHALRSAPESAARALHAGASGVREGETGSGTHLSAAAGRAAAADHAAVRAPASDAARRLRLRHGAQRQCVLLKREAEGLDYLPYPGELGKRIYENMSKEAWAQWVAHQTMLINENRLTPIEPKARAFLVAEMEKFFFGEGSEKPKEFVPK